MLRVHRRIARWAKAAQPYKSVIEFMLLLLGLVYATAFLSRTWAYPAASLSLQVAERVAREGGIDDVVIQASFAAQSGNLAVRSLITRCDLLDGPGACIPDCRTVGDTLAAGTIPRGDSRTWGCRYRMPHGACAEIAQEVQGRAAGVVILGSRWRATTITCRNGS